MARVVGFSTAIEELSVGGFKSIADEQSIDIGPLTILAGVNSSGKSSMMQPLLLLKQTLEASYDPGPLMLNGPNVKFTSAEQLLSRLGKGHSSDTFHVGIRLGWGDCKIVFRKEHQTGFKIEQMEVTLGAFEKWTIWPGMTETEIVKATMSFIELDHDAQPNAKGVEKHWEIARSRCFLTLVLSEQKRPALPKERASTLHPVDSWENLIPQVIHLPGLRGNPERTYPTSAVGPNFSGTFEKYTASVIAQWALNADKRLGLLNDDLRLLGLAGGVAAVPINAAQIELMVGRLPHVPPSRPEDRVNVADVGVGVSQTLPILVALHAAGDEDRLVYVEQPETHLHPRAQFALAQVFAAAANRGVRVVVETHSSLFLLGVQTMIAEGKLAPDKVKLHWFERSKNGKTTIRKAELDEAGRFGDWPVDFDDVTLKAESRFLDAAEARLARK